MIMTGKIISASETRDDENREIELRSLKDFIDLIEDTKNLSLIIYKEDDGTYLFVDYDY